ncbi:hypothetical protein FPQ18DRAFT_329425 [Pyronema domesticum]|nr:hypothetical protein FPQ18DRAFT_329425 [Pyronema domesticum]
MLAIALIMHRGFRILVGVALEIHSLSAAFLLYPTVEMVRNIWFSGSANQIYRVISEEHVTSYWIIFTCSLFNYIDRPTKELLIVCSCSLCQRRRHLYRAAAC